MTDAPEADEDKKAARKKRTPEEQRAEFEQAALKHGADGDEEAFKGVLRKLAKPKD